MSRKFFTLFAVVAVLVIVLSAVAPVFAGGPVTRIYRPESCKGMASKWYTRTGYMVINPKTSAYVCETRKSSWVEQRKWDLGVAKNAVNNTPTAVQDYINKDIDKNINKVTVCNIYQITTGQTQYCTMPQ